MTIASISTVLSWILIVGGFATIIFPIAPSIPTIWFGIFLYAISHNYATISQNFLLIVSLISVGTIILDYTLSRSGVQKLRAGPWGVLGAVIGGIGGALINPIFAYLIGPLVGAITIELLRGRDQVYSYQSGNYTVVAFMGGTIIKLLAAIAMIGFFILRLQGKI